MKENRDRGNKAGKTLLWQKIALIFFGLFVTAFALEISLRTAGFIILARQEHQNLQTVKQKGAYRILCLGESTTQGQYPQPLERILNRSRTGMRFSVIDKGVAFTKTSVILSNVESYLDEYRPDMVVAMMGINDWGKHVPFEAATASKGVLFIRSLKIYKLIRLLGLHLSAKVREMGFFDLGREGYQDQASSLKTKPVESRAGADPAELALKKAIELDPKNDSAWVQLGIFYRAQWKYPQAEACFQKAVELNPGNESAYVELGNLYRVQRRYVQAEAPLRKALELNPKNDSAYVELGQLNRFQGQYPQAEDFFRKALEFNPHNDAVCVQLAETYGEDKKFPQAEDFLKKAIEINPRNDNFYVQSGQFYQVQEKYPQAEDAFKRALELNPENLNALSWLGRVYQAQGKYALAEEVFKKADMLGPGNDRVLGALALLYEEMGRPEMAKDYAERANRLRLESCDPATVSNYRKLREILKKRGIRLVCVQYPMRSVEPLKKIFENEDDIIFVDNEKVFKEAVKQGSFEEYFWDAFAVEFGHCTQKGNNLLAQNIAEAILKELSR